MHRDKTVARILLILSVVHVVVAAPAIVRQRSLDVDEDATPAWEKRGNPGNTPQDLYPVPQMDNERPPASGAPQLDNDPQPPSGAPHLHNDPPPALGTPQLHDDPLAASGTSSVHDDLPLGSGEFDESYRFKDLPYSPSLHEGAPPLHEEAPSWASYETVARPTNNFMSDAAKKELITLGKYGATAAVTFGLIYGASKLFNSRAQPGGRDLTSSDVVVRDESTHPRPPRKPLPRALANLRNQDLRLLSVLTRRVLERLD